MFLKSLPKSYFTQRQLKSKRLCIICFLTMIFSSVAIDQLTKYASYKYLNTWSEEDNIRNYGQKPFKIIELGDRTTAKTTGPFFMFNFSYVRNPGAAWGFLANMDDNIRVPFFHVITILCIFFILFYIMTIPLSHPLARLALVFVFSGAIGNLIDRITLHYVIDFIDIRWNIFGWYYAFPNFNWADMCITVGAFLFLIDAVFIDIKRKNLIKKSLTN